MTIFISRKGVITLEKSDVLLLVEALKVAVNTKSINVLRGRSLVHIIGANGATVKVEV